MKTVLIAGQKVPQTAALAPMASVADSAYRTLCVQHGACMTTGELVSAKGLCYGSRGSAELCRITAAVRRRAGIYRGGGTENAAVLAGLD